MLKKPNKNGCYVNLLIEGLTFTVLDLYINQKRSMDHPDFPFNPFEQFATMAIQANKDLPLINRWLAEGKEKKDIRFEARRADGTMFRANTLYNTHCTGYYESYDKTIDEVACNVELKMEDIEMETPFHPWIARAMNDKENPGKIF